MANGKVLTGGSSSDVAGMYAVVGGSARTVQEAYLLKGGSSQLWYQNMVQISTLPVGTVVNNIYGSEDFIIVHHGCPNTSIYDASCTGTWLMAKNALAKMAYNSSANPSFADCTVKSWLNGDFYNQLKIKDYVKTAVIPFYDSSVNVHKGSDGYHSAKVFLLAAVEAGFYNCYTSDGAKLDYFDRTNDANAKRAVTYNGGGVEWWMRTPRYDRYESSQAVKPNTSGGYGRGWTYESHGIRPVFIVPGNLAAKKNGMVYPKLL